MILHVKGSGVKLLGVWGVHHPNDQKQGLCREIFLAVRILVGKFWKILENFI